MLENGVTNVLISIGEHRARAGSAALRATRLSAIGGVYGFGIPVRDRGVPRAVQRFELKAS
jgi:hypothetical protein